MNDNLPIIELPERFTLSDRLAKAVEAAREQTVLRVGYEVEIAGVEPITREGRANLRIYWRRKKPELHIVP